VNKNGKWESTYLMYKFLKIRYTSFSDSSCSATQQIPIILWNLIAHYEVHKKPPFTSTPVRLLQSTQHLLRPILVLSSHLYLHLSYWWYAPFILLYFITPILFDEQYKQTPMMHTQFSQPSSNLSSLRYKHSSPHVLTHPPSLSSFKPTQNKCNYNSLHQNVLTCTRIMKSAINTSKYKYT